MGADKESASFLLSIIGITNTVGRVACGALSDHPKVSTKHPTTELTYH